MPELPEVETVVRELDRKLKTKTIQEVEVRLPKIVALGPATVSNIRKASSSKVKLFIQKLKGQKIKSVTRRAKLIIIDFYGPLALLVHLKMTGQFIYFKKRELNKKVRILNRLTAPLLAMPSPYTHAIFTFHDGSKLFFNDVRQFGYLKLVTDEEVPHVRELSEFGPEPLKSDFTYEVFTNILKKRPNMPIKQFLLEPRLVAGIGNIYSDEILFQAKIKPSRRIKTLKPVERRVLFAAIPFILKKGIAAHGSSVGDFVRTDGSWGTMGKYHYVYLRAGQPCKLCGTMIQSMKFNGRTSSFCPLCQH